MTHFSPEYIINVVCCGMFYLKIKADARLQGIKRLHVCVYQGKNELSVASR